MIDRPGRVIEVRGARTNNLRDVGLGYLTLGQPLSTLSGGGRQGSAREPSSPRQAPPGSRAHRPRAGAYVRLQPAITRSRRLPE